MSYSDDKRRRYLNDVLLLAACLLISGIACIVLLCVSDPGAYIDVCGLRFLLSVDGYIVVTGGPDTEHEVVFYEDYPSEQIETVRDDDSYINVLQIEDGAVRMIFSNCPRQICVHNRPISRTGRTITCLPHEVAVSVVSGDPADASDVEGAYDAVTW